MVCVSSPTYPPSCETLRSVFAVTFIISTLYYQLVLTVLYLTCSVALLPENISNSANSARSNFKNMRLNMLNSVLSVYQCFSSESNRQHTQHLTADNLFTSESFLWKLSASCDDGVGHGFEKEKSNRQKQEVGMRKVQKKKNDCPPAVKCMTFPFFLHVFHCLCTFGCLFMIITPKM